MDIILTTPKSETGNAEREAADAKAYGGDTRYFRRFPLTAGPDIAEGERVYYVEDGFVRGFAILVWAEDFSGGYHCGTTGREYDPGTYFFMRADSWKWIKPIPMAGFRSYRYAERAGITRDTVEIVGGWLDPKPEVTQ